MPCERFPLRDAYGWHCCYAEGNRGAPPVHVAVPGAIRTLCGKAIKHTWVRQGTPEHFLAQKRDGGLACRACARLYDSTVRTITTCTACPLSGHGELWDGLCHADPEKPPRKIPEASYDGGPPRWCPLPIVLLTRSRR